MLSLGEIRKGVYVNELVLDKPIDKAKINANLRLYRRYRQPYQTAPQADRQQKNDACT